MKCLYHECGKIELVDYNNPDCFEPDILQCPKCKTLHQVKLIEGSEPEEEGF